MQKLMVFSISVAFAGVLLWLPGEAQADRKVRANEAIVWFDDIRKTTVELQFPEDQSGNNDNRSGLGDGTNPGQGAGRSNSTNQGTDNPNNKKK